MAKRLQKYSKDSKVQIRRAFSLAYHREPTDTQLSKTLAHLKKMTDYHQAHPPQTNKPPTQVARQMVEEMTGEEFSWTEPLDVYSNPKFVPDVKPWHVEASTRALAEVCLVLMNSNEFLHIY